MELFWKASAGILIAVLLIVTIEKQEKDIALLLTMLVSAMAVIVGLNFLKPVISFFHQLEELGDLQSGVLDILLKATGIGLVSELTSSVCRDSGNSALAQACKILGIMAMMSLSLPILETLLELIQTILGEI